MNGKDARLTRVHTAEGWQFIAKPNPEGTTWVLRGIVPLRGEVTADATVYELRRRGDKLVDHFDGHVVLQFCCGDSITFNLDGSTQYRRSNGSLRSELTSDGISIEHWVDGPRTAHAHWATVSVYEG